MVSGQRLFQETLLNSEQGLEKMCSFGVKSAAASAKLSALY